MRKKDEVFIESVLSIVCDGKTVDYDGWKLSAQIDWSSGSITVSAKTA